MALEIVHISPCFIDPLSDRNGGVAGYIKGLATAQARLGLNVKVIFPNLDLGRKFAKPVTNRKDGVTYDCIDKCFGKTGWLSAIRSSLNGVQVIHTHTPYSWRTEYAMALAARRNIKFVVHSHGKFTSTFRRQRRFIKSIWEAIFWQFTVRKADRLIVSGIDEKCACRIVGRFEIIPNGFDNTLYRPCPNSSRPENYLLYLGALEPRKNVDLLIEAFAHATATDARLLVVGPDTCGLLENLKGLANHLGCSHRVEFKGPAFGMDKIELMQKAKALVLVSKGEGMANVMMEAMGCQLPMIYSDGCVFSEVADRGGGLQVPATKEDVAHAMEQLLLDDGLHMRQKAALAELSDEYSWTIIASKSKVFYEALVSET